MLVTKRTLEVVIPKQAVPSLITRSGSKLAQISEVILHLEVFFLLSYLGAETYILTYTRMLETDVRSDGYSNRKWT